MKKIFQIFLCDDNFLNSNLIEQAEQFEKRKTHYLNLYPGYEYELITNNHAKDFLSAFDPEVLKCFDTLKPYAYRADLLRYCLLYFYGGWYFDLSIFPEFEFIPTRKFVLIKNQSNNLIENFILYAEPKSEFYSKLIESAVKKIQSRDIGSSPIHLFGPGLITDLYNQSNINSKDVYFGDYIYNNDDDPRLIFFDNKLFAVYKSIKLAARIDHYGFKGTNNYMYHWYNRNIYNKSLVNINDILSKLNRL